MDSLWTSLKKLVASDWECFQPQKAHSVCTSIHIYQEIKSRIFCRANKIDQNEAKVAAPHLTVPLAKFPPRRLLSQLDV